MRFISEFYGKMYNNYNIEFKLNMIYVFFFSIQKNHKKIIFIISLKNLHMSHEFFKLHNIFSIRYLQLNFTDYTYNND